MDVLWETNGRDGAEEIEDGLRMRELLVLLNGTIIGRVELKRSGDLVLRYEESWRDSRDSYPLSLSMPLGRREHPDGVVRPFLEGLLPDSREILQRWARQFHVSPGNPFALLSHMGEDCAGAVQLVAPDRIDGLLNAMEDGIDWLTDQEISERLRNLAQQNGTGRLPGDTGQFSLAGAQPKTALFHDGKGWGVPRGTVPTTHILKPPAQHDLDGFHINEHFCLTLGRQLGISTAESTVRFFGEEPTIVVERYDRRRTEAGAVHRLHQEDMCQALGIPPWTKYESEGGPGVPGIVELLLRESDDAPTDVGAFLDAQALNWIMAGTDAHAKNYSLLISSRSVGLAPLYDLLSALPYPGRFPFKKARVAMRIDREYQVWKIRRRHWEGLAQRCDLDPVPLVQRVAEVAEGIPEAVRETAALVRAQGVDHDIVDRLEEAITRHSEDCLSALS